jgi:hypothetical protein
MTAHEFSARAILDQMMSDPAGAQVLQTAYAGLRDGRWSEEYMDAIGQHGVRARTGWPMEQVAAFARVHGMVAAGDVAMVPVSTDGPPHADGEREANAAALSNLPHPFTASVGMTQQCGDSDGAVAWSEPIEVTVATRIIEPSADDFSRPYGLHYMIPPGKATLEIGSSLPSRTLMHLAMEGGAVARWPYGYSCFRLFVNLDYAAGIDRLAEGFEPMAAR